MLGVQFVASFTLVLIQARYLIVRRLWPALNVRQSDPTTLEIDVRVDRDDVKISTS